MIASPLGKSIAVEYCLSGHDSSFSISASSSNISFSTVKKSSPSLSPSGNRGRLGATPYPCSRCSAYSAPCQPDRHPVTSIDNPLIARIPPGTAATSAFDKTAWMRILSIRSFEVRSAFEQSRQSLIVARGAKLGIPLTVPCPPIEHQGTRSAIRPSRKRKGKCREELSDGSRSSADFNRTSLAMLPPQLYVS